MRQVTKIIGCFFALRLAENSPNFRKNARGRMKAWFVIFSPVFYQSGLRPKSAQKIVSFDQKTGTLESVDYIGKPSQRFFVSCFVGKVFHDESSADDQNISGPLHCFGQWLHVVE